MSDLTIPAADSNGGTTTSSGGDEGSGTNCFIDTSSDRFRGENFTLSVFKWIGILFIIIFFVMKKSLISCVTRQSLVTRGLIILFFQLALIIGNSCICFAGSYTFTLKTGWNSISLPYKETQITNAEGLSSAISNCTTVKQWDASQQKYVEHSKGSSENNFTVTSGKPYFVYVTANTSWQITGTSSAYINTSLITTTGSTAINAVAVPLSRSDLTDAEKLAADIPNCDAVWYWDSSAPGGYIGHPKGTEIRNFTVTAGYVYLVSVTQNGTWSYTPSSDDTDNDGDGYAENQSDCNDNNPAIYTGNTGDMQ